MVTFLFPEMQWSATNQGAYGILTASSGRRLFSPPPPPTPTVHSNYKSKMAGRTNDRELLALARTNKTPALQARLSRTKSDLRFELAGLQGHDEHQFDVHQLMMVSFWLLSLKASEIELSHHWCHCLCDCFTWSGFMLDKCDLREACRQFSIDLHDYHLLCLWNSQFYLTALGVLCFISRQFSLREYAEMLYCAVSFSSYPPSDPGWFWVMS